MVALRSRDAERFLASPPDGVRLFLVYGNDAGAITERARLIEKVALTRGGGDQVVRIGSESISAEPGRVAEELYSASLFGGEPVVSLLIQDGRHNVAGVVEPLLARPPEAAWLIIQGGELTRSSPLLKAFEASRHAAAAPCYHGDTADLAALVTAAAEDAGLTVEPEAMELIAAGLGGDRMATRGEIDKLFLYAGDAKLVTRQDVEAVLSDTAQVRTDEVIDLALLGDSEALETGLERLRSEGGSAAGLAAQMLRHLIQLQGFRVAVDRSGSVSGVLDGARPPVFSRRRASIEAALRTWRTPDLIAARTRVADAIATTRRHAGLETAAVSEALHQLALQARRLRLTQG